LTVTGLFTNSRVCYGIPGEQRQLSLIYPDISQALRALATIRRVISAMNAALSRCTSPQVCSPIAAASSAYSAPATGHEMQNGDQHQGV
jgi:hypothetical protein